MLQTPKVLTWDGHNINDGTNYTATLHISHGLPSLEAQFAPRAGAGAVIGNVTFPGRVLAPLEIAIENTASLTTLRRQLHQWFDNKDRVPRALVMRSPDGTRDTFVMAICLSLVQRGTSGGNVFIATLAVDGLTDQHYRWRKTSLTTQTWNITASGQTVVVNNVGEDEAYPVYRIKPTSNKTTGYAYKRWIPIRWLHNKTWKSYPIDILDGGLNTATLVTAGKMQADGDDVRAEVNGSQVNRWLARMNSSSTAVWINLTFKPKVELTLKAAIGAGDTVNTLDFNESVDKLPASGILMRSTEAFTYTGKDNSQKRVTGVTRAAKGTTAIAHSAGDLAWWVQHDIWLLYGNPTVAAPTVNDNYKPIIDTVASSNSFWQYAEFGENDGLRTGAVWTSGGGLNNSYTGSQATSSDPWDVLGQHAQAPDGLSSAFWQFYHPQEITNIEGIAGKKRMTVNKNYWIGYDLLTSIDGATWTQHLREVAPTVTDAWQALTTLVPGATPAAGTKYVRFTLYADRDVDYFAELTSIELTLNGALKPVSTVGAEQANYTLAATLTNQTTGQALGINFTMETNEELEVDTDGKEVTYLLDNSAQFQARSLIGGVRQEWLPLLPGNNTLKFDDVGTTGVTITIGYTERYYS